MGAAGRRSSLITGELLTRVLDAVGVDAVYGAPIDGLEVVRVDPSVAKTVALAHGRLNGRLAGWHPSDGTLRIAAAVGTSPPCSTCPYRAGSRSS
jgi:hypothetical protein